MSKVARTSAKKQKKDKFHKNKRIPCPFCKELILPEAKKCRFCKESLEEGNAAQEENSNLLKKKIYPAWPYKIWVFSMLVFLIAISFLNLDESGFWVSVMLGSVAFGFSAFISLLASIPNSRSKYGVATLLTFFIFFGVLFNYNTISSAFGLNSSSKNENVPSSDSVKITVSPTPTSTPSPSKKPAQVNKDSLAQTNKIECIGPDGKQFTTTMEECKNLNEKWGKSVDYIVNCTSPVECGGGTEAIPKSECDKPCARLNTQSNVDSPNVGGELQSTGIKNAVYITTWNTTYYCPSEYVDGVKTADAQYKSAFEIKNNCRSEISNSILNCKNPCYNLYYPNQSEIDSCKKSCDDLNEISYQWCDNAFDRVADGFMSLIKNCTSYR